MAAVIRLHGKNILKRLLQPTVSNCRAISTSKKNRDTVCHETVTEKAVTTKNWVSYGFHDTDQQIDRQAMHLTFFGAITLCLIFGGFAWAYLPDYQMRDWAQRQAYLEIRNRESKNLPYIDKNLIDPSKFTLPDDSELGDMEIII